MADVEAYIKAELQTCLEKISKAFVEAKLARLSLRLGALDIEVVDVRHVIQERRAHRLEPMSEDESAAYGDSQGPRP